MRPPVSRDDAVIVLEASDSLDIAHGRSLDTLRKLLLRRDEPPYLLGDRVRIIEDQLLLHLCDLCLTEN